MVGSSKILTVSYGTFSCTLEGFDDSFSTMKAIAEYFRDLASDDRYFGAEPPTPDAEMLARIAEREIARRVEARTEGTGIVLKAGQALSAPENKTAANEPDTSAPAMVSQPDAETDTADQPSAMAAAARHDMVEPAEVDEPPVETAAEDINAISSDEEAEVAEVLTEEEAEEPADHTPEAAEDQPEAEELSSDHDAAPETGEADDTDETDPWDYEAAASKLAESLAARPTPHRVTPTRVMPPHQDIPEDDALSGDPVDLPPAISTPPAHPDPESVAAKLERIRAVVGKSNRQDEETENEHAHDAVGASPSTPIEDDQPVAPEMSEAGDETADLPVEPGEATAEAPVAEDSAETEQQKAARPLRTRVIKMSLADFRKTLGQGDIEPVAETSPQDEPSLDVEAPEAENIAATPEMVDAIADEMADDDDLLSEDDYDDLTDEDIADLAALDGTTPEAVTEFETGLETEAALLSDEKEAELLAELAELERSEDIETGTELLTPAPVEMSDTDDAVATHEPESIDDAAVADEAEAAEDAVAAAAAGPLHTDDEDVATVAPELDVSRDMMTAWDMADEDDEDDRLNLFGGDDDDEDEHDRAILSDEGEDEDDLASDPRALRRQRAFESNPDDDKAVLSRLMEHTDDQLNDPDTNRRRESITQLKAAVAAKEAARQMGEQDAMSEETADEFRKDLRQAVRPRRPARVSDRPTTRTERPQTAPLKLVASQRVDIDPDQDVTAKRPAAPVRPRRVRLDEASEAEAARDAGSFEVFARDMGAQGLAELLEAAAAYTAYVEGSADFSRPQLMSKVRGLADRDFSREEGLRSFGTLLREGRIMKVRNGRFQVSEETRFHPERRAG
ncbi:hypothetical protein [Alexandriicola marinus]|uniref:hypothetical protein n=1 Tax=Alexandriicola marinus TaxID=2081710 RepID=UPI003B8479BF